LYIFKLAHNKLPYQTFRMVQTATFMTHAPACRAARTLILFSVPSRQYWE